MKIEIDIVIGKNKKLSLHIHSLFQYMKIMFYNYKNDIEYWYKYMFMVFLLKMPPMVCNTFFCSIPYIHNCSPAHINVYSSNMYVEIFHWMNFQDLSYYSHWVLSLAPLPFYKFFWHDIKQAVLHWEICAQVHDKTRHKVSETLLWYSKARKFHSCVVNWGLAIIKQ